jgi:hypothetical protein
LCVELQSYCEALGHDRCIIPQPIAALVAADKPARCTPQGEWRTSSRTEGSRKLQ